MMNDTAIQNKFFRGVWIVLFFLLISRLLSMAYVPLNDSTEARYGEIARIMLETGNWVTPMHHYGIPFWAKPPLSTWLSAGSMKILGVSAFAARLPGMLLSIGILGLIWHLARKRSGSLVAMTAVLVLASSFYFFINAGTVMTDPALLFCITLIFTSFWHAITYQSRLWSYVFFVGLGLGLLAKGPIALVLTGMPIFAWILWQKKWLALWQRLPWVKGSLLMLLIAAPWYGLAELRTPGFLNYFIVGEHIQRFLQPSWAGDKYGFAHSAPYGTIWLYALLGILPCTGLALVWLTRHFKALPKLCRDEDGWVIYLVLCTVLPLLFFTFARNIIYPYVFPSLPSFALLFSELANRTGLTLKAWQRFLPLAAMTGVAFLCGTAVFVFKPEWAKSQEFVVQAWQKQKPSPDSRLLYWSYKTEYSAQFYAKGKVDAVFNAKKLCHFLENNRENYVVFDSHKRKPLPSELTTQLELISTIKILSREMTLYRASPEFTCRSTLASN